MSTDNSGTGTIFPAGWMSPSSFFEAIFSLQADNSGSVLFHKCRSPQSVQNGITPCGTRGAVS